MATLKSLKLYQYDRGLILQSDIGFGEIAPLAGFSKETLSDAKEELLDVLRYGKKPKLPSVQWGLKCAETKLKSIHLPLCSLGPKPNFTTTKLKLGHLSLEDAISLVKKNLHLQLRLDFNKKWDLQKALLFSTHFKKEDFDYLEEPVEHFSDLVLFSKLTQFPIALDESIHCNWEEIPSLKTIVVKPTIVGSIPNIPSHLNLVLSSAHESGLGLLHIANKSKDLTPIGLDTYKPENDLLTSPINCSNGIFSWNYTDPPIDLKKLCPIAL